MLRAAFRCNMSRIQAYFPSAASPSCQWSNNFSILLSASVIHASQTPLPLIPTYANWIGV